MIIEDLFRSGNLPVLVSTSTLAMGVNLPAHLVVIKSTEQYINGSYCEYTESNILQMMGRAGRPQFDTSATAVIMTKNSKKAKYEQIIGGQQLVESTLHCHLAEHLNAEVVLQTITNLGLATEWLKSTFLYVRAVKNPKAYKLQPVNVEGQLKELCTREINDLIKSGVATMDGINVTPTEAGKIMAKYYMSLFSMKVFKNQIKEGAGLDDLIKVMCRCAEFNDHQLRVSEKRTLNELNKHIRFKLEHKVQNRDSKVYVLVQAVLGCLNHQDISLQQETYKIMRIVKRIAKCMCEFVLCVMPWDYKAVLNATLFAKCAEKSLWPDSTYVAKQFDGIGPKYAESLVSVGKTSFKALRESNPRDLERIMNIGTSKGNFYVNASAQLPDYCLLLSCNKVKQYTLKVELRCSLVNKADLLQGKTAGQRHSSLLLLADETANKIIYSEKIYDSFLMGNTFTYCTEYEATGSEDCTKIVAHIISETWIGIDKEETYSFDHPKKAGLVEKKQEKKDIADKEKKPVKTTKKKSDVGQTTKKKKPSICTQTLEKYRLLPKLPVQKLPKETVASLEKKKPLDKQDEHIVYMPGNEVDNWIDLDDPQSPEHQDCSPSYSPLYSPASSSCKSVKMCSPPKKKRYILEYPLPVLNFDIELESDEEDEFVDSPFGTLKLPKFKAPFESTAEVLNQKRKMSLSPVKDAESFVETVFATLGSSATPRISTYLSSWNFSSEHTGTPTDDPDCDVAMPNHTSLQEHGRRTSLHSMLKSQMMAQLPFY